MIAHDQPTTRRALVASAAVTAAGGLLTAACGEGGGGGSPARSAAPATITYLTVASAERQDGERKTFDEFERMVPNIRVDVVPAGAAWADVKAKWQVLHTGGSPPHVVHNGWGEWLDLKDAGVVTDVTPLFKRDKLAPDKVFFPTTLEHWSDKDQTWGIPVSVSVDVLAVNVEHLKQAGLALPPADPADRSWTAEKFLDYCQKLTRGDQRYAFAGSPSGYDQAGVSRGSWFGRLAWDDQAKKAQMNHPDFVRGLQFFKDLRDRHRVVPPPGAADFNFRNGNVSMQVHLSFRPALPMPWAPVALPYSGPGRSVSGRQFPNGFQLGKAPEVDAGWTLFRKLMEPALNSMMVAVNTHVVSPLRDPKASEETMKAFTAFSGNDARAYFLQQQYCKTSGYGLLKYADWGKLLPDLNARFTDYMGDRTSAQAYADEATRLIDLAIGAKK
jgi:hypothetical protein